MKSPLPAIDPQPRRSPLLKLAVYALSIGLSIALFALIRDHGSTLVAPTPNVSPAATSPTSPTSPTSANAFLHVLVALTAIIVLGQVLARLFALISQPPVIGEVVAGILLGPSLLGPDISSLILPQSVAPFLGIIAQLGVVLYMFLVGLELNPAVLKHRASTAVAVSHASILLPFLLGALLAIPLYQRLSSSDVPFTSFALFMGVAMSITAFPVLARILTDYRMSKTPLGVLALTCAAANDIVAWCLLALVVGIAKAQLGQGLFVVAGALAFIALMFLLARPAITWLSRRLARPDQSRTLASIVLVALLLSALATEAIGIHAIFGAFVLGVLIPHDSPAARALSGQLDRVVTILLLPAFFALTGMRTRIDLLSEPTQWLTCALLIAVATLGKFGGTLAAARLTGLSWRNGAILGTLMNTRGLMELIVLTVGLDLGVISPALFSMMVIMALATTALTSPILRLLKVQALPDTEMELVATPKVAREQVADYR